MNIHKRSYSRYYFQDNSGTFYFRIVTTSSLRKRFPNIQKEIRRSLHTASRQIAKQKATKLYITVTNEFIKAIESFDTIDRAIAYIPAVFSIKGKLPLSKKTELNSITNQIVAGHKDLLESRFLEDITDKELSILKSFGNGIDLLCQMQFNFNDQHEYEVDSAASSQIFSLMQKSAKRLIQLIKHEVQKSVPSSLICYEPDSTNSDLNFKSFSSTCDAFIKERIAGGNWKNKTSSSYSATFYLFKEIIGDIDISIINSNHCRSFKEKLQSLPKNHTKILKYKNIPVSTLVSNRNTSKNKLISIETINKHLGRISSLFHWCTQQDYMQRNYMNGMLIRTQKQVKNPRLPFSINELNSLFRDNIYTHGKMLHSYYFWLPLISLYSGARIQEICQLELDDIHSIDGIFVLDINSNSKNKRLKNTNSIRVIPVHQKLIDIGLITQANRLKRLKYKALFPELSKNSDDRDAHSQSASKWFARYKNKHHFKADGIKVFHSFRHTFIDELKSLNTPEHISAALSGHGHDNITYGRYGGPDRISILNEHLQNIQYEGFNTDDIKWLPK